MDGYWSVAQVVMVEFSPVIAVRKGFLPQIRFSFLLLLSTIHHLPANQIDLPTLCSMKDAEIDQTNTKYQGEQSTMKDSPSYSYSPWPHFIFYR